MTGRPSSCLCGVCAKCRHRSRARARYQALSVEERRAIVARRDPERVRANDAASYQRNRAKRDAAARAWRLEHPEEARAIYRRWVERNRVKRAAHAAVWTAIRSGRLTRPDACERCGAVGSVDGHHDDYARPLDVRWLCVGCHAEQHRRAA